VSDRTLQNLNHPELQKLPNDKAIAILAKLHKESDRLGKTLVD
jgi:hypothetical protein